MVWKIHLMSFSKMEVQTSWKGLNEDGLENTFGEFFQDESSKIMEGTEWKGSDEEEIYFQSNSANAQADEKKKEPEKYRIVTRSRTLVDAIEDEDILDEERNEALMMVEEALIGDPTSFNFHKDTKKSHGWIEVIKKRFSTWISTMSGVSGL
jgi:hypothetical protein